LTAPNVGLEFPVSTLFRREVAAVLAKDLEKDFRDTRFSVELRSGRDAELAARIAAFSAGDGDTGKLAQKLAILKRREHDFEIKRLALPDAPDGYTEQWQANAAAAVATAHRDINRMRRDLRLPEIPRPDDVRRADSMRMAFVRAVRDGKPLPAMPRHRK
jgi:hypothetical protein